MICVAVIQEAICQMASEGVSAKVQEDFSMVPQNYGGWFFSFFFSSWMLRVQNG